MLLADNGHAFRLLVQAQAAVEAEVAKAKENP
jgi:hypothetical protein